MFATYTGSDWVQLAMYIIVVASIIAVAQVLAGFGTRWFDAKRLQRRLRKQYPGMQITVEPSDRQYKDGETDVVETEFQADTGKWKQTTTIVRIFDHNPEVGSHERIDE